MAKTPKWAHLKGKLERFVAHGDDPGFIDKVNESRTQYVGLGPKDLAREFNIQRKLKKELEAKVKLQNIELEALSQLLVENLEAEEVQKIGLASGETVYLSSEPYFTIEDKKLLMGWIKRMRMVNLLSIHYKTLTSLGKDLLLAGKKVPPGVKVFLKTSARVTGAKGSEEDSDEVAA